MDNFRSRRMVDMEAFRARNQISDVHVCLHTRVALSSCTVKGSAHIGQLVLSGFVPVRPNTDRCDGFIFCVKMRGLKMRGRCGWARAASGSSAHVSRPVCAPAHAQL